jgi:glycosyltransferase involved in cell wall biosynthesis
MPLRLAVFVSHPIQHFAPWHREIAKNNDIDLRVFFSCDWGAEDYFDDKFQTEFKWDIPLVEGYQHEFLRIRKRPTQLNYWQVDNPDVESALDRFNPDVVKVFGYAHKTNWRVANWTRRKRRPLLLYSDSNALVQRSAWRRLAKRAIVSRFYNKVDGALFVGENNLEYHLQYGLPPERLFPGSLPIDQNRLLSAVPDPIVARRKLREHYGIPQTAFVLMFCGKYSAEKRPLDVVAAAHAAAAKGVPAWSLVVGEGSERRRIEAYIRNNDVRNTVLTGFVNQSHIPKYYAASDAVLISSESDSHPLVVSEAGTFGLPVIVSNRVGCIGMSDTARPGINATVYPCGDVEKLVERIDDLYSDSTRYSAMSGAARKIAMTQDVGVAARDLAKAVHKLRKLGPR